MTQPLGVVRGDGRSMCSETNASKTAGGYPPAQGHGQEHGQEQEQEQEQEQGQGQGQGQGETQRLY